MAMTESLDAPMMDFSGDDIPMQTSSSTGWIHPEATMDDDSNTNTGDVEIDMDYHQEPFEYEMADDSFAEVHDVEVIDVSQAHTPALIDTVVEDATEAFPSVPEHDLTDPHDHSPSGSPPTLVVQVPSPTPQTAQDEEAHGNTGTEILEPSEWNQDHSESSTVPHSPHPPERHQSQTEPTKSDDATESTPNYDVDAPTEQGQSHHSTPTPTEQAQPVSPHAESTHHFADHWGEDENPVPSHASSGDPHEVSDGIFIDPPPPVILSLGDSEKECYLFNRPADNSPTADNEGVVNDSLFLHDLPTLYYEPLAKVFQALRSDNRIAQLFDLSRGELVIDAYDLVDLVISEDNSYTNEVSFHDLNLIHDHADLAGPLRIRIGCNPQRFIARYRELRSKLEQFNLLDEADVDDAQLREHYDPAEQPSPRDGQDYLTQEEEATETLILEEDDRPNVEGQSDVPGSAAPVVDRFAEGDLSNDAELGQARSVDDEESTVYPLSGDDHSEQPAGVTKDDREQETAVVPDSEGGYPGPQEDLDAAAVHEHSDDHNAPRLGENTTEYEEVVVINEDYETDYNENDHGSEHGEIVTIEGDTRDAGWETTPSGTQHTQDDLEQHEDQDGTGGTDKHFDSIDLTAPNPDEDHITGQQGTDTDSIGQRTLDEFADAQEETRDDPHLHEGEESNSTTDQSNELNPDLDQFGDEFNWDEDFGVDFDGEFDEFESQGDTETKLPDSQEPTSAKSSKRGFDEVDSDTANEEETPGGVSPNSKRKKVL